MYLIQVCLPCSEVSKRFQNEPGVIASVDSNTHLTHPDCLSTQCRQKMKPSVYMSRLHSQELTAKTNLYIETVMDSTLIVELQFSIWYLTSYLHLFTSRGQDQDFSFIYANCKICTVYPTRLESIRETWRECALMKGRGKPQKSQKPLKK